MFKSYLISQCLLAALFLGGIGAVNFWADPYGTFLGKNGAGKERLVAFSSRRIWANVTINRVIHGDYPTLVVGNSRTWFGIDPGYAAPEGRIYNAAFLGCNLENIYTVLRNIWGKKPISTLIIGLDYTMERQENNLTDEAFSPLNGLESLLGYQTLKDSLVTLVKRWSRSCRVRPNGFRRLDLIRRTPGEYRAYLDSAEQLFDQVANVPIEQGKGWLYLKAIVNECRTRKIRLILFVSPFHAEILERMARCGAYDEFETWMHRVVEIAHEGHPATTSDVTVWQFCGYNPITTDPFPERASVDGMRWYFEASHYKPEVGNLILDRIFENASAQVPDGFGIRLTRQNIDACCEKIRKDLEARTLASLKTASTDRR